MHIVKNLFIICVLVSLAVPCHAQDKINFYTLATWLQTTYASPIVRPNAIQPISKINIPTIFFIMPKDTGDTSKGTINMFTVKLTNGKIFTVYSVDTTCFLALPEAFIFANKGNSLQIKLLTAVGATAVTK